MPSSFTIFSTAKPAGTSTGPTFATDANTNDVALWYAVITGQLPGFVYSQTVGTGTAEQPQFQLWTNGAQIVRHTNTWGVAAGATGNLASVLVEVSQDTGATYATVCTVANTFDASGNLTATTGGGGFIGWLSYLLGKVKALLSSFNTHTATTGTGVHGLGTMAIQNLTAVNIDGGTIDATAIGGVSAAAVRAKTYQSVGVALGAISGATAVDWSAGDYFTATLSVGASFTFSNLPAAGVLQGITLELTNPGTVTNPFPVATKWPGGVVPTFTASGTDVYELYCRDGSTVRAVQATKDSR